MQIMTNAGARRCAPALILLIFLILLALPAAAQDTSGVSDDAVNTVAGKLYCPVCENITLDTCGTAACDDWRYEIRLQLEEGRTEQQIIDDFVMRFGDRVVGTPQDPTLRMLSLVTPWLVIAAGLLAVAYIVIRRRPTSRPETVQTTPTDQYQDLLEQDLKG